ncbi:MAG: helix-hairpin-helix domain-containing protein [Vicinamibacterales bacterium]
MQGVVSAFLFALLLAFSIVWPVVAQGVLPDGPGKDVTVSACGQCHAPEIVASVRLTPDGWRETLTAMVERGAKANERELETIFTYVSTHFKGEAEKPLNVNTATSVELESVAGLLRKEAAVLIAHRENVGPCKKLDDLKKVAGLDYKKIEARKDRLVCM